MKALVTGATGFVGQHLLKELEAQGHQASGFGVDLPNIDLLNPKQVSKVDLGQFEVIFHLAALAAVGASFADPAGTIRANRGMQANLMQSCVDHNWQPLFLVVSSANVYSNSADCPLSENSPASADSPYSESKLAQELSAQQYGKLGQRYIVARPFNHIGPGQAEGFLVADLAKQIVAAEQGQASAVKTGNLDSKRDYTDVRDVVKAYVALTEKGKEGEVYNICSGKAVSGKEILEELLAHAKANITLEQDPSKMRPSDAQVRFGDSSKLRKLTGWEPTIPLSQTLLDVLNDWRQRQA